MVGWHHQLDGHEFEQALELGVGQGSLACCNPWGHKELYMTNLDSILKSRNIILSTKVCLVKAMVFPIVMYGCESWTIKKAERQITDAFELLEKTLESPLDCKEIQPVHPKGDQSWVFIGRADVEAETPILWPPHVKS